MIHTDTQTHTQTHTHTQNHQWLKCFYFIVLFFLGQAFHFQGHLHSQDSCWSSGHHVHFPESRREKGEGCQPFE